MSQRIAYALSYIPADDRPTWLKMGMAIKSELGDAGYDLWDDWSRTADNYNANAAKSVWRSCRGAGITLGSLFGEAKSRGWRDDDRHHCPSQEQLQARRQEMQERMTREGQERERIAQAAARKAAWILKQTVQEQHAYLHSKGWPEARSFVWRPEPEQNLLCIPMRIRGSLAGLQMIDKHGDKKYLTGQRTSEAEYLIDNSGRGAQDWFVEGYATGLSLRDCLHALRMRYRIHITFSAGNLIKMARAIGSGFVVADHDASATGQKAAEQTGLPYYLPPPGDFNDLHQLVGTFRASQQLRQWIQQQGANQ